MSATATVRRTRPRGEVRRSQILDAAAQVFTENGYGGATIDLVVERAGASKGTVYSFFGGKDGLFAAIVEERCERILSAFGDPEVVGSDVLCALAHIARRYMEVVLAPDAVGLYRLIIAEGVRFPELTRTFYRLGPDRANAHLAGILSVWRERGLVRLDDPQLAAVQFFDAVSGDLHRRAMAGIIPKNIRAAIQRRVDNAVQVFWNGIRVDGRPA
ncbi:transcriptional regulator, TetR family [Rhizobiales bacterium GAS113]|nr:transcriptional regulator, TetR family [Rhizobiales bacterium GAS113]